MITGGLFVGSAKHTYAAQNELSGKHVLFISSYSESFVTVPDQIKGLREVFTANQILMEIEYMDTKRFSNQENISYFYESLNYKLNTGVKYDLLLVADDAALQFAIDYQEDLFPEIPIVFFAINDKERAALADANPLMAGSIEETSLEENIEIAMELQPEATKVAAIVDGTLTGQGDRKQFEKACASFPQLEPVILDVSMTSFDDFALMLEQIDRSTILLFLSMNQDNSGQYLELRDQFAFMQKHAKVPPFRASVGGVGEGLFGGKMISYEEMASVAANTAIEVMNGKEINIIPMITETPYYYMFDYNLIQKYGIDESKIPEEAILINKKVHPLEKYRLYIFGALGIMTVLSLFVLVLMFENKKLKRMQRDLSTSHDELTSTYEELTASEEELKEQYEAVELNSQKVNELYKKYELAIKGTNSAVWELNLETEQVEISESFLDIVGREIVLRGNVYEILKTLVDEEYREKIIQDIRNYLYHGQEEIYIEAPTLDREGHKRWILIRGKSFEESEDKVNMIFGIFLDITISKKREEYIDYLAYHDYLTGLPNRVRFMTKLQEQLDSGAKGAVLLFDIDDFKSVNDTLGHVYGDELLKQIADRLRSLSDHHLLAARLGGDEFLILISEEEGTSLVENYMERLRICFEACFDIDGMENYIHYSMGITRFPEDSKDINQLIMNADTAMYEVKHNGKNNCVYYHADMKKQVQTKKEIEYILRQAVMEDGFKLVYQPQVDVKTGEISGYEALLRMKHHKISPAIFIPIAEETGQILEIGRWVAKTVIRQIAEWKEMGFSEKPVGINYSSKQLRDRDYISFLCQHLQENGISSNYIEIEITEGILLENNLQTMEFLNQLKSHGFRIALDDFGTGYSSLNYLTYIPVDTVKLDKSINDKFLNLEDSTVINSLIQLVHSLQLSIVAEGIEEWDKFKRLQISGCDTIQGYLFCKPLEKEEVELIYNKKYELQSSTE